MEKLMNRLTKYAATSAALATLLLAGSLIESRQSQAKGGYSSPVTVMNTSSAPVPVSGALSLGLPANGSFQSSVSPAANATVGVGIAVGINIGISSITLTNTGGSQSLVTIGEAFFTSTFPACSGPIIGFNGSKLFHVLVPANQSIHLTYPTPFVINPQSNGEPCIGVSTSNGNTEVSFNGFLQ
jgi:hypothetical protein